MTADDTPTDRTTTRASALLAATSWLPVTDGEDALLALAERFAAWIEGGSATTNHGSAKTCDCYSVCEHRDDCGLAPDNGSTKADRILWNERPPARVGGGGGDIDEIVMHDVGMVHIEQMDTRCWWIALYKDPYSDDSPYWMGNFVADSRGRMRFVEQENDRIEWDDDDCHEEEQ